MQVDPIPEWVGACYDTGGGEACPPQDAASDGRDLPSTRQVDEELGPQP